MKKILLSIILTVPFYTIAQQQVKCGNADVLKPYLENSAAAKRNADIIDSVKTAFFNDPQKLADAQNATYIIPVVFHVFANNAQALVPVAQCQSALDKANEDFNAWNADLSTVDPEFIGRASSIKINFVLAQKDTNGNATLGVTYHPLDSGFGAYQVMDNIIAQYAWNNYKYMNIYVMNDLFGNGVNNNSGIAYPPDTYNSNNKIDRIVYNYWYLGNTGSSIADPEFQSTITHEYGHWLSLGHTFGGNCNDADGIADTPPSDAACGGCGPNAVHCGGNINGENYMDYNASCYKMYTQGQVTKMLAALQHPTRFPLWQQSNLIAAGLGQYVGINDVNKQEIKCIVNDNILYTDAEKFFIYDLLGNLVVQQSNSYNYSLSHIASGAYIISLEKEGQQQFKKITVLKQ